MRHSRRSSRDNSGEQRFVQKFHAGNAIGAETVVPLEVLMPLLAHPLAVFAPLIERRIENHDLPARAQAAQGFFSVRW